jgi:hypothetical protein
MSVDLLLELEHCNCNGEMHVTINGQSIDSKIVELKVTLPTTVTISLSGKNYQLDTKLDSSGLIIADKYVKLKRLCIGRVPIEEQNLFKICSYQTDQGNIIQSNYWGFNGVVTLNFEHENFIKYLLSINNKFLLIN